MKKLKNLEVDLVDPGYYEGHDLVEQPTVSDVAPTILAEFGIETPGTMTGRPVFGDRRV